MKIKMIDIDTSEIQQIKYIQDKMIKDLVEKWHDLLKKNNLNPLSVYQNVSYECTEKGINVTITAIPKDLSTLYDE